MPIDEENPQSTATPNKNNCNLPKIISSDLVQGSVQMVQGCEEIRISEGH